jgi:hypothetical protein
MHHILTAYGRLLGFVAGLCLLQACNLTIDLDSYPYKGEGEVDDGMPPLVDMPGDMPSDMPEPVDMRDMAEPPDMGPDMLDMDMEIIVDLPSGPPELIFTELLVDAPGMSAEPGEFFEIYSKGPTSIDLKDLCIQLVNEDSMNDPDNYVPGIITDLGGQSVVLSPGSYSIFINGAGSDMPAMDHPVIEALLTDLPDNVNLFYIGAGSGLFSNGGTRALEIVEGSFCEGEVLDRIAWRGALHGSVISEDDLSPKVSSASGISWSLQSDGYSAAGNDTTEHWCLAVQERTYEGGKVLADPGKLFNGTCEKMSNQ